MRKQSVFRLWKQFAGRWIVSPEILWNMYLKPWRINNMKYFRALLASALCAGALVEFLFWGGAGVGFIILFLFLLPFVASTIWSYRDAFTVSASAGLKTTIKTPLIPPASAITILALVNAVYLL